MFKNKQNKKNKKRLKVTYNELITILLRENVDMKFINYCRQMSIMNSGSTKMRKAIIWRCPGCGKRNIESQSYRFLAVRCKNCGRIIEAEYDFE